MLIKSDFKDYYDSIQAQDGERSVIYNRFPVELIVQCNNNITDINKKCPGTFYVFNNYAPRVSVKSYVIGFCGKVYPLLKLRNECDKHGLIHTENISVYCHSFDDVNKFFLENFNSKDIQNWELNRYKRGNPFWSIRKSLFENYFNQFEKKNLKVEKYFEKHPYPIFLISCIKNGYSKVDLKTEFNYPLKNLEFFRIFDPYQAYQEISMWMNNQASPEKPIPEISNADMIAAKGFDKFSFRKDKKEERR